MSMGLTYLAPHRDLLQWPQPAHTIREIQNRQRKRWLHAEDGKVRGDSARIHMQPSAERALHRLDQGLLLDRIEVPTGPFH